VATILAGLHPAAASVIQASTSAPSAAAGDMALLILVIALAFLAFAVRITRQLGELLSQLFHVAAAVGGTLVMMIIVAVLTIAVLLHG